MSGCFVLQSHNAVSMRLHNKLSAWVDKWREANVTPEEDKQCQDWLMGRVPNTKPCKTSCNNKNNLDKAPYYPYNKYSVIYDPQPQTGTGVNR